MNQLVLYKAARKALAEAHRVDEVKSVHDKSIAMQHYAMQAKDRQLIEWATEIRLRAERKVGELLKQMAERGERARGGGDIADKSSPRRTLSDLGVSKKQSHQWQKIAALDESAFEQKIKTAQKKVIAAVDGMSQQEKAARRAEREQELTAKIAALPNKKYGVILNGGLSRIRARPAWIAPRTITIRRQRPA
jgi:hypothetical protein